MKKLSMVAVGLSSLCCMLFAWFTTIVVSAEVIPAVREGTLDVETTSMILNRHWVGNEIYLIISFYAVCSTIFGYTAFRLAKKL